MAVSIESTRQDKIAAHVLKRAGGMQGSLFDPTTLFSVENQARHNEVWNKDVKFLFPSDDRIRYDGFSGAHYIKSYRRVGKQRRVRWSKPEDLEAGIRMADNVREAYDPKTGQEIEKTKMVIGLVRNLSNSFRQTGLKPMDVKLIAEQTASRLIESGFVNSQADVKTDIVQKIVKAAGLDSKDRVNGPRSRMILSNVWVDLIRELLIGKVTENKYSRIGAKLIRERELERFVLEQTIAYIDNLSGSSSSFEDSRSVREFKLFTRDFLSREVVKIKPYSKIAAVSRFLIRNTGTPDEVEQLRKYIGQDADMYKGTRPLDKLTWEEVLRRLSGVRRDIRLTLDLGDLYLNTKTDQRKEALEKFMNERKRDTVTI